MNDRGSYFYNIRAHDREWSWLMKKMIVPITGVAILQIMFQFALFFR